MKEDRTGSKICVLQKWEVLHPLMAIGQNTDRISVLMILDSRRAEVKFSSLWSVSTSVLFQISRCSGWSSIPSLGVNESDTDVCDFCERLDCEWTPERTCSSVNVLSTWLCVVAVVKSRGGGSFQPVVNITHQGCRFVVSTHLGGNTSELVLDRLCQQNVLCVVLWDWSAVVYYCSLFIYIYMCVSQVKSSFRWRAWHLASYLHLICDFWGGGREGVALKFHLLTDCQS